MTSSRLRFSNRLSLLAIVAFILSHPASAQGEIRKIYLPLAFLFDASPTLTICVSMAFNGIPSDDHSFGPLLSADGRYLVFSSYANTLVRVELFDNVLDGYLRDLLTGETIQIPVPGETTTRKEPASVQSFSSDGRFVVFVASPGPLAVDPAQIFIFDRETNESSLLSLVAGGIQVNGSSYDPTISADGRLVAFISEATNLVSGDTNSRPDIFVHDRQTGETRRVSVTSGGIQANNLSFYPSISADGRFVAFASYATNLVIGDTNRLTDTFVHDLQTGETERVSVASDGTQADRSSGEVAISADGRYVAFDSEATNLVSGDTNDYKDIFVHDRWTGNTQRVSVSSSNVQANNYSQGISISADGSFIVFSSLASNLVMDDTNDYIDIFIHDRQTGRTQRVSRSTAGIQGNRNSAFPSISGDGDVMAFQSDANNLVNGDTNNKTDIFIYQRVAMAEK